MRALPCLSPLLQKGAHWRLTCSVLFDDPIDEDSDTRKLRCARFVLQFCVGLGVCVGVCGCVWVWVCVAEGLLFFAGRPRHVRGLMMSA